jgi:hypothetical protein
MNKIIILAVVAILMLVGNAYMNNKIKALKYCDLNVVVCQN